MKALEAKAYDTKKEMDVLDALEQVRRINKRKLNAANTERLLLDAMVKQDGAGEKFVENLNQQGVQESLNQLTKQEAIDREEFQKRKKALTGDCDD